MSATGLIPPGAARPLARVLALCIAGDAAVGIACPVLGGDCFYGFFALVAYPVMLSGPLGLWLPRLAMRRSGSLAGRAAVSLAGAVALAGLIVAGHAVAVRIFNADAYGPVLLRPRMLEIQLALAGAYYAGLGVIAYVRAGRGDALD